MTPQTALVLVAAAPLLKPGAVLERAVSVSVSGDTGKLPARQWPRDDKGFGHASGHSDEDHAEEGGGAEDATVLERTTRGGWTKVAHPDGKSGWIQAGQALPDPQAGKVDEWTLERLASSLNSLKFTSGLLQMRTTAELEAWHSHMPREGCHTASPRTCGKISLDFDLPNTEDRLIKGTDLYVFDGSGFSYWQPLIYSDGEPPSFHYAGSFTIAPPESPRFKNARLLPFTFSCQEPENRAMPAQTMLNAGPLETAGSSELFKELNHVLQLQSAGEPSRMVAVDHFSYHYPDESSKDETARVDALWVYLRHIGGLAEIRCGLDLVIKAPPGPTDDHGTPSTDTRPEGANRWGMCACHAAQSAGSPLCGALRRVRATRFGDLPLL